MGLIAQLKEDFDFYRRINRQQGFMAMLFDRFFLVCANYRFGYWACHLNMPVVGALMRSLYVVTNLCISTVTGTDIRSGATIGSRFWVHTSFGIMIADGVVIGDDCTI